MWFAIVGKRTDHGTRARTRSPAENPEPRNTSAWSDLQPICLDEIGGRAGVVVQLDRAGVGHLAAASRIERRLAQLDEEEVVLEGLVRADLREDVGLRVPDELRGEVGAAREVQRPLRLAGAPRARDLAVTLHLDAIPVDVDRLAALPGELDSELDREAVGRSERERLLAGDRLARSELLEQPEAALERLAEALLLEPSDAAISSARGGSSGYASPICSTTTPDRRCTS